MKVTVGKIVSTRLSAAGFSAADFARGLEVLKRMGLPTRDPKLVRARSRILATANESLDRGELFDKGTVAEKLALLSTLEAGDAKAADVTILRRLMADEDATVRGKAYDRLATCQAANAASAAEVCAALALDDGVGLAQRLDALARMAEFETTPNQAHWTRLLASR